MKKYKGKCGVKCGECREELKQLWHTYFVTVANMLLVHYHRSGDLKQAVDARNYAHLALFVNGGETPMRN